MSRRKNTEADEVEELLRVAEDDLLLKLSVNSHLKSDRSIDSDLDSRFQSLKSRSSKLKPKPKSNQSSSSSSSVVLPNPPPPAAIGDFDGDHENPDFDHLLARFAALKGTLPSNFSSTTTITTSTAKNQLPKNDDEDEVDKVIRWAIDAARLDPSPCSDDDEVNCDSHSDDNDDDDDDDDDDNDTDTDDDDFRDVKHKGRKK